MRGSTPSAVGGGIAVLRPDLGQTEFRMRTKLTVSEGIGACPSLQLLSTSMFRQGCTAHDRFGISSFDWGIATLQTIISAEPMSREDKADGLRRTGTYQRLAADRWATTLLVAAYYAWSSTSSMLAVAGTLMYGAG